MSSASPPRPVAADPGPVADRPDSATPDSRPVLDDPAQPVLDWWQVMLETNPVHRDEQSAWHVFRHADVSQVLADPATFSSDTSALLPDQEDLRLFSRGNIVNMDPPHHRQVRTLVNQAFTPRVVAGLEPRIVEVTTALLDRVRGRQAFDLVDALAYPLPVTVIAELLGVPARDMALFRSWADGLFSVQATDATVLPTEEQTAEVAPVVREMNDYLLQHIRHRRKHPADDLLGRLTTAGVPDRGRDAARPAGDGLTDAARPTGDGFSDSGLTEAGLTDEEIVGLAGVLLLAGHITTTALLGNAVLAFDRHPAAGAEVRADRSLVPDAIEEVLRWRTPFPRLGRMTTRDAELAGAVIPARSIVVPWVGAANHDPRRFPDPERFDIHRSTQGQLAFGHGIHFCLGAPLARLEARVALNLLMDRYSTLAVDRAHVRYQNPWIMNSMLSLPVQVSS
jgi:cytochrome P450